MKFGLLNSGAVVETCDDPISMFHPDIASKFQEIPDHVDIGWGLIDGKWVELQLNSHGIKPTELPVLIKNSDFKKLFTFKERAALIKASTTDPVVQDILKEMELSPDGFVVATQSHKDFIDYLSEIGVITKDRVNDIVANKFP